MMDMDFTFVRVEGGFPKFRTKIGQVVFWNSVFALAGIGVISYSLMPLIFYETSTNVFPSMNQGRGSWTLYGPSGSVAWLMVASISAYFNLILTGALGAEDETAWIYQSQFFKLYNTMVAIAMSFTSAIVLFYYVDQLNSEEAYTGFAAGGFGCLVAAGSTLAVLLAKWNPNKRTRKF